MQLVTPNMRSRFHSPRISQEVRMSTGRGLRIKEEIEVGEKEKLP